MQETRVTQETDIALYGDTYYVYQDSNGNVIWPAIKFINRTVNGKKTKSTIATYRQAIRSLFDFLAYKEKKWSDMTDNLMVKYREWQLDRSVSDPRWRGNVNVTKNNINHDYLFPVYEFYYWAQEQGLHPMLLGVQPDFGEQFQITSALPLRDKTVSKKQGPGMKRLYPRMYTDCALSDSTENKVVEDWELDELNDYIRTHYDGYERSSLLMMVRIAEGNGARPIALSGFVRSQFTQQIIDRELLDTDKDSMKVTPLVQKGGNTMAMHFDLILILGIKWYIENHLETFLEETGFQTHDGHLFLNPRTGLPLTPEQITKIFSAITTKLGWPYGKSIYGLRHRYANRQMGLQADINAELGFSTEENTLALQVADKMTHRSNKTLIKHYLRDRMRHGHQTRHYEQEARIKELESNLEHLALEKHQAIETSEIERKIANQALIKATREKERGDRIEQENRKLRQLLENKNRC